MNTSFRNWGRFVMFFFVVLIFSETMESSTVPDFGHPKSSATGSFSILKPLCLPSFRNSEVGHAIHGGSWNCSPWGFQWCGSKDKHDVTLGPLKGLVVRSPFSLALQRNLSFCAWSNKASWNMWLPLDRPQVVIQWMSLKVKVYLLGFLDHWKLVANHRIQHLLLVRVMNGACPNLNLYAAFTISI